MLYDIFEIIPVSREIAETAGECRERYAGKSIKLPIIDMLIAATAMINRSILVTRNIKHFPISDVDIYQNIYSKS
jgi:predicted nucleic acid-binding protein